MDLTVPANYLILLSETVGPIGAALIFIGIIITISLVQFFTTFYKNKNFINKIKNAFDISLSSKLESNTKAISEELKCLQDTDNILFDTMRNMAQATITIDKKLKYQLSDEDSVAILKNITKGTFFLDIMVSSMVTSATLEHRENNIDEAKKELKLELINKYNAYIDKLNMFHASIKIGDFVKSNYEYDILILIEKIVEIIFNRNIDNSIKYSRINNIFAEFSSIIVNGFTEQLEKIINGMVDD